LEERRVGALLDQELRKRPGQRDEELVHTLRVKYCTMQLRNVQVWGCATGRGPAAAAAGCRSWGGPPPEAAGRRWAAATCTVHLTPETLHSTALQMRADTFAYTSNCLEEPVAHECCAAAGWARQRLAASYRALHDYYCQNIQQVRHGRQCGRQVLLAFLLLFPSLARPPARLHCLAPTLSLCSAFPSLSPHQQCIACLCLPRYR
jgi:hypothetical protein